MAAGHREECASASTGLSWVPVDIQVVQCLRGKTEQWLWSGLCHQLEQVVVCHGLACGQVNQDLSPGKWDNNGTCLP